MTLACAALLLSACTATDPGQAGAGPVTPARAPELPPRPHELSLRGVDPCSLLTEAQLDELEVNSEPRRASEQRDGPTCSLDVDRTKPYYSYYVETITTAGVRSRLGGARADNTTTQAGQVTGFPALTRYAPGSPPSDCETLVDVADGQTLRVQLYPVTQDAFDQNQLCEMAERAAALALRTLKATR